MRIYTMTATFGKLTHETLTLTPGLNVIQAPNEWGKSTWCAFLTAMLYGLDTRSHSTKTALSDKERYTPWSGAPMAGRIDLNWNGRDITIERRTKGRTVFGDFKAYETHTGLPVPELTAHNCGQVLLGVEKTVFTRSAMIRLTDLPVTQDEALRRRLNALVTTGDDSGAGEDLERRLRELKNRCRHNRTGLLPQAEAEAAALDGKLQELEVLETQSRKLRQRCAVLEEKTAELENHQMALTHRAAQENVRRLRAAEEAVRQAEQTCRIMEVQCAALPTRDQANQTLEQLRELQAQWNRVQMEEDLSDNGGLPDDSPFRGMTPEAAREKAAQDTAEYLRLRKWHPIWLILGLLTMAAGVLTYFLAPDFRAFGVSAMAAGPLTAILWVVAITQRRRKAARIAEPYGSLDAAQWAALSENYVNQFNSYRQSQSQRQGRIAALRDRTRQLCRECSFGETLDRWQKINSQWDAMDASHRELLQRRKELQSLASLPVNAPVPGRPDKLTLSQAETQQALTDAARELRQLQHRLGQCQGQMEAIGHRTALEARKSALDRRIRQLEDTHAALTLALTTLEQARASLQRRFAPRITSRAQDILNRLTDGRYDRLVLDSDLTLHATAREEDTLRNVLWRSDGTTDLLYLALRLAVAGELTPDAPLILDDALVRFDDERLAQAMAVLKEESAHRQILLFTCHTRELQYIS